MESSRTLVLSMEVLNLTTLMLLMVSYIVIFFFFNKNKINFTTFNLIFFWHLLFCIIFYYYSFYNEADAHGFFKQAIIKFHNFNIGGVFIINFTRFFIHYLGFNYFNCFLIFNFIGTIGILFLCKSLRQVRNDIGDIGYLFFFIIFIPSMHFWSSAIGKDAISFLAINIFVWSSLILKERKFLMILSIGIMFLVRPHISSIMLFSLMISLFIYSEINLFRKVIYIIALCIIALISINFVLSYVGIGNIITYDPFVFHLNVLPEYIEAREASNLSETAGIHLSPMSPFMKVFTYLYRPLPLETNHIFQLLVSIENIFLLFFSFMGLLGFLINSKIKTTPSQSKTILAIYIFISVIILGYTSANFGITSRQKWMIFPAILLLAYQYSPKSIKLFNK